MRWVVGLLIFLIGSTLATPFNKSALNAKAQNAKPKADSKQLSVVELFIGALTNKKSTKVSLAVPCIPRDVPFLQTLLKSVNAQTVKPLEVIIALSETSEEQGMRIQNELSAIYPVRVFAEPDSVYAGENRNRATRQAKGSIVSYVDADDEMHPQRIEIVESILSETGANCILHAYTYDKKSANDRRFNWHTATLIKGRELYQGTLKTDHASPDSEVEIKPKGIGINFSVHQGHPTCLRSVAMECEHPPNAERGNDCIFLRTVLNRFGPKDTTMMFVNLPLTYYYPSSHSDNKGLPEGKKIRPMSNVQIETASLEEDCHCSKQYDPLWSDEEHVEKSSPVKSSLAQSDVEVAWAQGEAKARDDEQLKLRGIGPRVS